MVFCVLSRKRRRQLYHAKKSLKPKKTVKRSIKKKATKDSNCYDQPLNEPRKVIPLHTKLEALALYEKLRDEKKQAKDALLEPRPARLSREQLKERKERLNKLKKVACRNVGKAVKQQFPHVVSHPGQIGKWAKVASRESWAEMSATARAQVACTTNSWRKKLNLPLKGRPEGGKIPLRLQQELDMLMVEMSSGRSSISVRKEMVTAESVVPWRVTSASY